jgi:hypothetical protein
MKKKEKKNAFYNLKNIFFCYSFLVGPLALHFKDDLYNLRRCSYNIINH